MPELARESDRFLCPEIYISDGSLPEGRILAAKFMGGAIDIDPSRQLTALESTALTLTSLGYTALQASEIANVSQESIVNRLFYVNEKIDAGHIGMSKVIAKSIEQDVIYVSQAGPSPPNLTAREQRVWGSICSGATNNDIARQEAVSSRYVTRVSGRLYDKLGVTNRVSASLLHNMAVQTSEPTKFKPDIYDKRRIREVIFKGGILVSYTDGSLTELENNLLLMRMTGLSLDECAIALQRDFGINTTTDSLQPKLESLQSKHGVEDTGALFRHMLHDGYFTVERECSQLTEPLAPRHAEIWGLIAQGVTKQAISQELGIHPKTARNQIPALYKALEVDNFQAALLRHVMTFPAPEARATTNTYELRQTPGLRLPRPRRNRT